MLHAIDLILYSGKLWQSLVSKFFGYYQIKICQFELNTKSSDPHILFPPIPIKRRFTKYNARQCYLLYGVRLELTFYFMLIRHS